MKEGKNRVLAEVWGWVWRLALAVVIAQAVHLMVFQPVSVKGESMTDTLQNGEIMYVSKPEYLLGDPARGDVVICHYPRPRGELRQACHRSARRRGRDPLQSGVRKRRAAG